MKDQWTDEDYMRAAVELAENFWGAGSVAYGPFNLSFAYSAFIVDSPTTRLFKDALAAQLVRQYYEAVKIEGDDPDVDGAVPIDCYIIYEKDPMGVIMTLVDCKDKWANG